MNCSVTELPEVVRAGRVGVLGRGKVISVGNRRYAIAFMNATAQSLHLDVGAVISWTAKRTSDGAVESGGTTVAKSSYDKYAVMLPLPPVTDFVAGDVVYYRIATLNVAKWFHDPDRHGLLNDGPALPAEEPAVAEQTAEGETA